MLTSADECNISFPMRYQHSTTKYCTMIDIKNNGKILTYRLLPKSKELEKTLNDYIAFSKPL